jgi:hypothetical protein
MKYLKFILFGFVILSLVHCVTSRVTPYPQFDYSPTQAKKVLMYYLPPTVPFEIIGEVTGSGAALASWRTVRDTMKRNAATIGGDAIIVVDKKTPYVGTYRTAGTGNAFVYGNYIYYTYKPGASYAVRRKYILGVVIKWKTEKQFL